MKPEEAKAELKTMGFNEDGNPAIGSPEIRAKIGDYIIDAWHSQNQIFNPERMLVDLYNGDYEWDYTGVFKNVNGTFALIYGSGCSCNGRSDSCTIDIFPDIDQVLEKLKTEKWPRWTEARRQILTLIATGGLS